MLDPRPRANLSVLRVSIPHIIKRDTIILCLLTYFRSATSSVVESVMQAARSGSLIIGSSNLLPSEACYWLTCTKSISVARSFALEYNKRELTTLPKLLDSSQRCRFAMERERQRCGVMMGGRERLDILCEIIKPSLIICPLNVPFDNRYSAKSCNKHNTTKQNLKIQDGGGRHLKKSKTCHISATVPPISTKFGTATHFNPLEAADC